MATSDEPADREREHAGQPSYSVDEVVAKMDAMLATRRAELELERVRVDSERWVAELGDKQHPMPLVRVVSSWPMPEEFFTLPADVQAEILSEFEGVAPCSTAIYLSRKHGGLAGRTMTEALRAGVPVARIVQLSRDWVAEHGGPAESGYAPDAAA